MNAAPAELAIVMPLTTTKWPNELHVRIDPEVSGLARVNYVMPEMAKTISAQRLGRRVARVPLSVVDRAAANTGFLIGLGRTKF